MLGKRGQQLSEYAVMFGVAAMAFIGTQTFVSRRVYSALRATSHNVLGTVQPSDQGSSLTRSTETTREQGNRFNVHTESVARSTGSSQSGFIMAEARGPYLGEVLVLDSSSALDLAGRLCGNDCEEFLGMTQDAKGGWVTARFKTKDGKGRTVRFRVVVPAKFDKTKMRWFAKIEAEIDGQLVILNVEGIPKEIAKGRGIELILAMVLRAKAVKDWARPYLKKVKGSEEEDVLDAALKELGIDMETFEDGDESASEVIQVVAGALGLSEKELLALAEDEEALEDKLWDLSEDQLEDVEEKLNREFEPLDELALKLAEQDPQGDLGMALTTPDGENIFVTVDDDDQNGLRDVVGGFMDPNDPLSLRLDFDEDQDYEDPGLVVTTMGDFMPDDLDALKEQRDEQTDQQVEDAEKTLEREIPDEESREDVLGLFRDYIRGPARKGYVGQEEDRENGETFREYVDRRRQEDGDDWSSETEAALDRAADPDDPLHQTLLDLSGDAKDESSVQAETLVPKGDDDFALLPSKETVFYQNGKPILIEEADGDFKLPEGVSGELVVDDDTKLPLGINQDEDDELEVVFASGSGLPNVEFVGHRGADGTMDYDRVTTREVYEDVQTDPQTGKTETVEKTKAGSTDMVVGINRFGDHDDAEAFVVRTKVEDEDGNLVDRTFLILDSNGNHVLDPEDSEQRRPIEVASKPVKGEDEGRGVAASTLRHWIEENQESNNPVPAGKDGTHVDVGISGVMDGLPEFIEVNGERVEVAWFIVEPTSATDLIDASDGVDVGEAAGAIAGALEDNGNPLTLTTPPIVQLPDDRITLEEVRMGGTHPGEPDGHEVVGGDVRVHTGGYVGFLRERADAEGVDVPIDGSPPLSIWQREGEGSPDWTPLFDPTGELSDESLTSPADGGTGGGQPPGGQGTCTTPQGFLIPC